MRLNLKGSPQMNIELEGGRVLTLSPPRKCDVARFKALPEKLSADILSELLELFSELMSRNSQDITFTAQELEESWTLGDALFFAEEYAKFIKGIEMMKSVELPYYPADNSGRHDYDIVTSWEKLISGYMMINLYEVEQMDYYEYLVIRRDAFISMLSGTQKGQEYLENAWRLTLTKPDRAGLRRRFGKEAKHGKQR